MEKKRKVNPFIGVAEIPEGMSGYDQAYLEYEVHEVPEKVGDGPYDYVMKQVVITHEKDIKSYIESQAGDVGVYAYIDRAARGLVDIEQVSLSDQVVDMSSAPTTLMEAAALGERAAQNFAKLPSDLTKGASMEEFLASVSPEDIIKYYANKAAGTEVKEEN